MDNMVLYDFRILLRSSQLKAARNDGNTYRHCEEERRSNPEQQQKLYMINNTETSNHYLPVMKRGGAEN